MAQAPTRTWRRRPPRALKPHQGTERNDVADADFCCCPLDWLRIPGSSRRSGRHSLAAGYFREMCPSPTSCRLPRWATPLRRSGPAHVFHPRRPPSMMCGHAACFWPADMVGSVRASVMAPPLRRPSRVVKAVQIVGSLVMVNNPGLTTYGTSWSRLEAVSQRFYIREPYAACCGYGGDETLAGPGDTRIPGTPDALETFGACDCTLPAHFPHFTLLSACAPPLRPLHGLAWPSPPRSGDCLLYSERESGRSAV